MSEQRPPEPFKIGDVYLLKKVSIKNTRFAQQCWYEDVSIPAGRYPIYATEVHPYTMEVVYYTTFIRLTGTVTEDYFPLTAFGIPIGAYNREKNKGSASFVTLNFPTYTLAKAVLEDEGRLEWMATVMNVRLEPEYTPINLTFMEDGVAKDFYGIVKRYQ